jgi:hypothetical protein
MCAVVFVRDSFQNDTWSYVTTLSDEAQALASSHQVATTAAATTTIKPFRHNECDWELVELVFI